MCVIIVKPAGVKMPSNNILALAHAHNPHGCGFVTPNHYCRTLDFKTFKRELAKVKTSEPCIMHFRFATHGSVKKSNCHPFRRGDVYFAHNGILDIHPRGDMTDSETAFADYIYPTIAEYGLDSDDTRYVIAGLLGFSKFAILQGDQVRIFGDFASRGDGCLYSNLRFLPYTRSWWGRGENGRKCLAYF